MKDCQWHCQEFSSPALSNEIIALHAQQAEIETAYFLLFLFLFWDFCLVFLSVCLSLFPSLPLSFLRGSGEVVGCLPDFRFCVLPLWFICLHFFSGIFFIQP